jgi:hypothetical protein
LVEPRSAAVIVTTRSNRFHPLSALELQRRGAVRRLTACLLLGAAGWASTGRAKNSRDRVCADPKALGEAERRQRQLDNYVENSPDPRTTCSGCGFFTPAAEPGACGNCRLFNGPANPKGKCDDWTAAGQT